MSNRNSNAHFDLAPQVEIERSTFDRSCNIHTSFNVGQLIPFYIDEVLPGDTFQIQTSKVARLQTLIAPVMDNLYLDTYYFFVPNRLVWEHWKNFCGESENAWIPEATYTVPQINYFAAAAEGTVTDYFGIPTGTIATVANHQSVNALPFRAYGLIWNDWFRDENLQDPLLIYKGDNAVGYSSSDPLTGGYPLKANKYHDYFSSCLPAPQKGEDVTFVYGMAPIRTFVEDFYTAETGHQPMRVRQTSDGAYPPDQIVMGMATDGRVSIDSSFTGYSATKTLFPSNLYADLTYPKAYRGGQLVDSNNMTINKLRQAFQIQRMLERDARGGTRYIEILKAHFQVTSPDARLQRPEYLGGNRVPLNIEQVVNTTGNESLSLLPGDVSGWSQTSDVSYDVEKSFVEHGFIIGLMCARYDHTYQQGLERMWSRETRYDYYWPALAHLGEKPVYKREIYNHDPSKGSKVFGYQEAWAEYRYKPNYVTGAMRTEANKSLDIWHFADYYSEEPYLSDTWIQEDKNNVDRALTVKSNVENQIFMDIYVKNKATRPMPLYSIPGMMDHF